MAHWAELDNDNIVIRVIVTNNDDPNGDEGEKWVHERLGGRWVKTSYNGNFRGCFAGEGYRYDPESDTFVPPTPYNNGFEVFRGLEFKVGPGVFPPEPYDAVLNAVLDEVVGSGFSTMIDIGAGTGALSICAASESGNATVYAVEQYPEAYGWLDLNISEHADLLADRNSSVVPVMCSADRIPKELVEIIGKVDAIIANIPVIPSQESGSGEYPETSIYGGEDGLDNVRQVVPVAVKMLKPGGVLHMRFTPGQQDAVEGMFPQEGWEMSFSPDMMRAVRTVAG